MKVRCLRPVLSSLLALIMLCVAASAVAAEKSAPKEGSGKIATTWIMWVKNGQAQKFENAVKEHAAWRKNAGETFNWSIYQPVVGADLDSYVIRSDGHTWKEIDEHATWEQQHQSGAQFEKQVGPYVQRMEHYFEQDDSKHSHWTASKDYRYFGVTHYQFKPGSGATANAAMDKIQKAVTDTKWPYSYAISDVIGGSGGINIVEPMKSYADMADPNPSMMQILSKSLGSKQAAKGAMHDFGSSIESHNYTVYVHRNDLSTPAKK